MIVVIMQDNFAFESLGQKQDARMAPAMPEGKRREAP